MLDLRTHFITVDRPCKEGTVEVFEQPVSASGVRRATLTITALGVYEAELNGAKIGDLMFTPRLYILSQESALSGLRCDGASGRG